MNYFDGGVRRSDPQISQISTDFCNAMWPSICENLRNLWMSRLTVRTEEGNTNLN